MYSVSTGVFAAFIVTVLVVVWGLSGGGVAHKADKPDAPEASALFDIESFLDEYRRNWTPRSRGRLLERFVKERDTLLPQARSLVTIPDHPLLRECVEIAGELRLEELRSPIITLATTGDEALRPVAIRSAARIAPWSREKLEELLRSRHIPSLCAALEVAATCPDAPHEALAHFLGHPEQSVRDSAVLAFPTESHPAAQQAVLEFLADGPEQGIVHAVRALGRMPLTGASESVLGEQLASHEPRLRSAALEALTRDNRHLQRPDLVWQRVVAPDSGLAEQCIACVCLERTGWFDRDAVADALPGLAPRVQYHAARCLIRVGDRRGIAALLTLIEEGTAGDAAHPIRQLLALLSRTWINEDPAVWRRWFESRYEPMPKQLPAVPPPGR